jgi:hypothetical protein
MGDIAEEFRGYAEQCREMARTAKELESKAAWNALAERWVNCAREQEAYRPRSVFPDRNRRSRANGRTAYQEAS